MVTVPPLPTASPASAPAVAVPPLQPSSSPVALPSTLPTLAPTAPSDSAVVEFGKPLPMQGATSLNTVPRGIPPASSASSWQQPTYFQSSNFGVTVPAGTILNVSYPGQTELKLEAGDRQEVLVLQTEIRNAAGAIVIPQGSYVIGQFNSEREGSRFIASAIRTSDRVIPFSADSELITGNRSLSTSSLALYSGAGALAGGAISRFSGWGLLLGGAAGAATNFFTAPKAAVIQPGQLIQLRVLRDIP